MIRFLICSWFPSKWSILLLSALQVQTTTILSFKCNKLEFSPYIVNLTLSCGFLLYTIRMIQSFLSMVAIQALVQSLVKKLTTATRYWMGLPIHTTFTADAFPVLASLASCIKFKYWCMPTKTKMDPHLPERHISTLVCPIFPSWLNLTPHPSR